MKVHEAIRRFLVAEGVDTAFSFLSDATVEMVANLQEATDDPLDVVEARHEQAAVAMADGYARATDSVGVVVVGRGPAIAQTGTALTTARKADSKVLVLVATTSRRTATDPLNKEFRQRSFLETLLDDVLAVPDDEVLVPRFAEAFRRLHDGGGPVAVELPADLIAAETDHADDWAASTIGSSRTTAGGTRFEPDPSAVDAAAERLLAADPSVPTTILAGRGAVRADAGDAIETLAERTDALLATTLQAQGYFSEHPFSLGFVGGFGSPVANEYLRRSDTVVAVGCSLNEHTTDRGRLLDDSTVVQIDADPGAIERHTRVDLGVVGDAADAVEALVAELDRRDADATSGVRSEEVRRRIAEAAPFPEREFEVAPDRVDPREVVTGLDAILPEDRLVVTDTGHFMAWIFDGVTVADPADYMWTSDFGSVGLGGPMGYGAARAVEDRTPIVFCGDGGFMMSLQELDTAVREGLSTVVVVMNDGGLGAEYQRLYHDDEPTAAAEIESPDLAAVADDFGATGLEIRSERDLERAEDLLDGGVTGPVVLDCKIDRDVYHRFFDDHA